ncbi:hypothetical protein [Geodermatophilus poikilotrophus]|uniref:Uncharacterized protein n=1 Tax=Geodermatophilus poikilotrophus TaxID=1333667 RepID=A0A1I0FS36_9ACTN|nr:hypothetical protein [Geodermatophilus poikilotrophus]SET60356.1 hypothetical protein SAMN04488546_2941 [Geodermatophilus poikilotrophus]
MISTTWTFAPAGARGPVGLAVRTAACAVESPVVARLRALPVTPPATRRPGTRVPGLTGIGVFALPAVDAFGTGYAQQVSRRTTTEHNGTTLGIHSSRRPSS